MIDLYAYLFEKLDVKLFYDSKTNSKILVLGSKRFNYVLPDYWSSELVFLYYRNLKPWNSDYFENDTPLKDFCRKLSYFPSELKTKEQVDLLLKLLDPLA